MTIERIRNYILYATIFLVPVAFLPIFSNPLVVPKVFILVFGVALALVTTATMIFQKGSLQIKITVFNLSVLFLAATSLLSAFLRTPNKLDAFTLPGTATAIAASAIIFFLLSSSEDKQKSSLVQASLITSGAVLSVLAILSFLGLLGFVPGLPGGINEAYFSTVNGILPGVLFLVSVLPLSIAGAIRNKDMIKKSLNVVASIIMSLAVVIGIFFYANRVSAPKGAPAGLKLPPVGTSWSVLVDTLKVSPILGAGHGNYITVFNRFRPASYNTTADWNVRFNSSRSFFMTYITETGLLGAAAVGLLLIVFTRLIKTHIKVRSKNKNSELIEVNLPGVENLVSLTLLLLGLLLFPGSLALTMLLFVLLSISDKGRDTIIPLKTIQYDSGAASRAPAIVVALLLIALSGYSMLRVSRVTAAEYYYQKSLIAASRNDVATTFNNLTMAIEQAPRSDRYYITLSRLSLAAARSIAQKEELTDTDRQNLGSVVRDSINAAKQAVSLNPTRALNWEVLANTYRAIIPVAQGADQFAIQTYSQAIALDPLNTDFRIALGSVYYQLGQFDQAVEVFRLAVLTKPDHANARFNLSAAYREQGDIQRAIQEVTIVLSLVEPDSQDFEFAKAELERLQEQAGSGIEPSEGPASGEELNPPVQEEELDPKLELPEGAEPPEAPEDELEDEENSQSPSPTGTPSPSPTNIP